jgi:hypothetical protein
MLVGSAVAGTSRGPGPRQSGDLSGSYQRRVGPVAGGRQLGVWRRESDWRTTRTFRYCARAWPWRRSVVPVALTAPSRGMCSALTAHPSLLTGSAASHASNCRGIALPDGGLLPWSRRAAGIGRGRLQGRNHRVYQRVSALLLPCPRLLPWGRVRGIGPLLVREPGQSDRPRARLLGLRPVLQRLQTRHFLSQGPGKVAVCTKCPNMPVAGIWHPAWPTRSHGAGPRRGQRTNGDESRLCRGPGIHPGSWYGLFQRGWPWMLRSVGQRRRACNATDGVDALLVENV